MPQKGSIKSSAILSPILTSKPEELLTESELSLLEFESAMFLIIPRDHNRSVHGGNPSQRQNTKFNVKINW